MAVAQTSDIDDMHVPNIPWPKRRGPNVCGQNTMNRFRLAAAAGFGG